jgi:beta-aspartyl-peptidase (threonine type)
LAGKFIIAIHGGAGAIERAHDDLPPAHAALLAALEAGRARLASGGRALDAVTAAVAALEACGEFNAGKGAVRASDGSISLDAAVMDGPSRAAGAVASLVGFASPVRVARLVLERTPHVLLAGAGAAAFALEQGVAPAPDGYFVPASSRRAPALAASHGTVGAVALDATGALAVATSTGGITGKLPGRVGDSPIIGAGTYADDRCAVSATGTGEMFVRAVFGFRVAQAIARGTALTAATHAALAEVSTLGGAGGCIALTAAGELDMPFTTPGMFRGFADADRIETAVGR